ncbi:MAG: hypothetical protein AAB802_03045 [Patescibacteria group bacterium]
MINLKKFILPILFATLFWVGTESVSAVIQLDDGLRPDNLPTFEASDAVNEENPETAATQTIILFVGNLLSQVLLFAGAVTILFLIIAGANYIFAFGKDERIEKGKRGIFWAIVGLLIIMLSYSIVRGLVGVLLQVDESVT